MSTCPHAWCNAIHTGPELDRDPDSYHRKEQTVTVGDFTTRYVLTIGENGEPHLDWDPSCYFEVDATEWTFMDDLTTAVALIRDDWNQFLHEHAPVPEAALATGS